MVDDIKLKTAIPITRNKTYHFILPLLARRGFFESVLNCYLGDENNKPEYTLNKIFVHVEDYEEEYTQLDTFYQFYELEDDTYMFVYNISDRFLEDYTNFCNGKYSKMSDKAKDLICKFSDRRPIMKSQVYKVLFKTNEQRQYIEELVGEKLPKDAEVASIPDMDKEVYKYCKIKRGRELI